MKSGKEVKILIPASLGLAILILDSSTAIEGARTGLEVCIQTVLPSLFPFLFLSSILTSFLLSGSLRSSRFLCRLYRIPETTDGILLTGLLGGYPVGAKCIGEAVECGQLSHADGKRMLTFCNAAGPAFLFGITGSLFTQHWIPWTLWGLHIFSGLCIARILPSGPGHSHRRPAKQTTDIAQRLRHSVQLMGEVCGWIVLMRIVITFAEKWFLGSLPASWKILTEGMLELSNGCIGLQQIKNTGLRFVLCSVLLGFGGLCVALQTASAARSVSQQTYLPGKLIQALISFLSAYTVQYFAFDVEQRVSLPWLFLSGLFIFLCVFTYFRVKNKKSCGISERVGV